jgi:hypothetical protein
MIEGILTGVAAGVVLALIGVLGKKFSEIVILKRDMRTMWMKYEQLEKRIEKIDDGQDKLNTKVAVIESQRK